MKTVSDGTQKGGPLKKFLARSAAITHFLAFLAFAVAAYILILGGVKFHLGGLSISATQLRNPLLLTVLFTLLGKALHPSFPLGNTLLGRMGHWLRIRIGTLKKHRDRTAVFWSAVVFLNILLLVPFLFATGGTVIPIPRSNPPGGWYDIVVFFLVRENADFFRISVDFYLIVTLLVLSRNSKWHDSVRKACSAWYFLLLGYQLWEALSLKIFGQKPVLYSDLLLLKDAVYLVADVWSARLFDSMMRTVFFSAIVATVVHHCLVSIGNNIRRFRITPRWILFGVLIWGLAIFMKSRFSFQDKRPITQYVTPNIVENVWQSVKGFRTLAGGRLASHDSHLAGRIKIEEKPNIYLFMIESYGKIVADHPDLRDGYSELMTKIGRRLSEQGWFVATNYSTAPIKGGRSWLSMASVMSGIRVDNEAFYRLLLRRIPHYYHLGRLLQDLGYQTFVLQPTMRPRPGFSFDQYETFYDYNTWIYYDSLDYHAEEYGWGMIPDQYSLNYTHDRYLKDAPQPYFFSFMTVTSHVPWYDLPPYVDDWTQLNDPNRGRNASSVNSNRNAKKTATTRDLARHVRKTLGVRDLFKPEDYMDHMTYQLTVVFDYILQKAQDNSLILIVGDHQPPVLTRGERDYETPIHVVTKNNRVIAGLEEYGFVPAAYKMPQSDGQIKHEGILSMLARVLVSHYGTSGGQSLPEYHPDGIPISILRE